MLLSRRHQNQRPGGLWMWWRLSYSKLLASLHHARPPLCPHARLQLQRDGPGCSALLGKRMAGDFYKALLIWRDPAWAGGQLWDPAASCTGAKRMPEGSVCALASDAHPRGAHCSPSAHAPRCGETQRGIPEPPGSPAAPGFMLFHNVFWGKIAVF